MSACVIDWTENDEITDNEDQTKGRKTKEKIRSVSKDEASRRKKQKRHSSEYDTESVSSGGSGKPEMQLEMDPSVLQRRQKQIDFGKNTVGYQNYLTKVPITKRTKAHPRTPDKYSKYSRRSWDMLIKIWRKNLHEYDINGKLYETESNLDKDSN